MRYLYEVIVVNPKTDEVLLDTKVVGENKEEAIVGCEIKSTVEGKGLKIKDVSVVVVELGQVKEPVRKVKIIDEEDK